MFINNLDLTVTNQVVAVEFGMARERAVHRPSVVDMHDLRAALFEDLKDGEILCLGFLQSPLVPQDEPKVIAEIRHLHFSLITQSLL